MNFLHTLFIFSLTFFILVFVHELGHFALARFFKVKVLSFSVGLGKKLLSFTDKKGTVYSLSLLPLGGYVKMLYSQDCDDSEKLKDAAFDKKHPLKRIIIILAGPIANFILAVFIYWGMFIYGTQSLKPIVTDIYPNSPLSSSIVIDKPVIIKSINSKTVHDYHDAYMKLSLALGQDSFQISFADIDDESSSYSYTIDNFDFNVDSLRGVDLLKRIGLKKYQPQYTSVISYVSKTSKSGLQKGDKLISYDDFKFVSNERLVEYIQHKKDNKINLKINRNGAVIDVVSYPQYNPDLQAYLLGVSFAAEPIPEYYFHFSGFNFKDSFIKACHKLLEVVIFTFKAVKNIIFGIFSLNDLTGPIEIASVAKKTFSFGWHYYLSFVALLSVNLGVINLLPIPVSDGGQICSNLFELIFQRSLPSLFSNFLTYLGLTFIFSLSIYVIVCDLLRMIGFDL